MPKSKTKDEEFKFRLAPEDRRKLDRLADRFSVSRAGVLRMGLNRLFEAEFGPDPVSAKAKKT